MPLLDDPGHRELIESLTDASGAIHPLVHDPQVSAVVVISAHHESGAPDVVEVYPPPLPTLGSDDKVPSTLYYDYHGFPPETYEIDFPNPGSAWLAERAKALLEAAGGPSPPLKVKYADANRGFDHGVFVPLKVLGLRPEVPVVQVSLGLATGRPSEMGAAAARTFDLGERLKPLRAEGVLLVGSGMEFHNMSGFFRRTPCSPSGVPWSKLSGDFDAALRAQLCSGEPLSKRAFASEWVQRLPNAAEVHPREEHLLPLFAILGASEADDQLEAVPSQMDEINLSHFVWKGSAGMGHTKTSEVFTGEQP